MLIDVFDSDVNKPVGEYGFAGFKPLRKIGVYGGDYQVAKSVTSDLWPLIVPSPFPTFTAHEGLEATQTIKNREQLDSHYLLYIIQAELSLDNRQVAINDLRKSLKTDDQRLGPPQKGHDFRRALVLSVVNGFN